MNNVLSDNIRIFIELTFELTNVQLAEKYNRTLNDIRAYKDEIRKLGHIVGTGYPKSPTQDYDKYIDVKYDRVLILGDCEIPDQDDTIFSMATDLAHRFNIKHLILNGDFVALDPFSNWPVTSHRKIDFSQELEITEKTVVTFLKHFKSVDYITGNHERRLPHKVEGNINMGFFLRHLEDLTFSDYAYCHLTSGDSDILVGHPDNYSKNAQAVPTRIANIQLKNVVCGHTHRLSFGYHESAQFWAVDGGHCRDSKKTGYKAKRLNTHPQWNPGFVMIIDGFPHLIDKNGFNFWMNIRPTEKFFSSIQNIGLD